MITIDIAKQITAKQITTCLTDERIHRNIH